MDSRAVAVAFDCDVFVHALFGTLARGVGVCDGVMSVVTETYTVMRHTCVLLLELLAYFHASLHFAPFMQLSLLSPVVLGVCVTW